ncbi:MAG: bifunctional folylpolyglutamate synthase/dihydrofolate synthase [Sneathiella sp.]|nr:bifunctional folylpolyglutamate synthase/dihydrofolate synthase [Sneathiella sp.]
MPERHSDQILKRLLALHPKVIDLSLDRMETILEKMGNPERSLPPVIHVAGTNGKGSLLAYLRAILEAAGLKVHVYTSPHLVKFAERIVLAGEVISEPELSELLLECERINGPDPITYFEITTAAAFKAFADTPADILLLETGLGGRLDATNMVEKPAATAITPISHDHEQFLGSDLAGIAGEKAGILKSRVPAVFGPQGDIPGHVLETRALELSAPAFAHGKDWTAATNTSGGWTYKGGKLSGDYDLPRLYGLHQIPNAGTALAVLEQLTDFDITKDHVKTGLQTVKWPARMQHLVKGDLVRSLPPHVEIWLDGGHNEAAGARISETFAQMQEENPLPLFMICGMMSTKDQASFLRHFQPLTERMITVDIPGESGATPADELAKIGIQVGIDTQTATGLEDAIDSLYPYLQRHPCRLLIGGSLYLAGQVLRTNS